MVEVLDKKLEQIAELLNESRKFAASHPSREVQLLQAMQEYAAADKQDVLDGAIKLFNQFEAMNQLSGRFSQSAESSGIKAQSGSNISSMCVHDDGVYEIDEQCVQSKERPTNEMLWLLVMMQMLK